MSSFLQEQIDGAIEALKALQDFGYLLLNQITHPVREAFKTF